MEKYEQLNLFEFETQQPEQGEQKEYSLIVRSKNGGGWCPISSSHDLEKVKSTAIKLYEQGGYSLVLSEYDIGGYDYSTIKQVEFLVGSKDEFAKNNHQTFDEYLDDLDDRNRFSRRMYGYYLEQQGA